MSEPDRIAQFKYMTEADPTNELGHFSLGRAYLEAGQVPEAMAALQRVLELNPSFSKAYALLGAAQRQQGDTAAAVATFTKGYAIAHERGDLMPRNEMAAGLKELGAPIPETQAPTLTLELSAAGNIQCRRCGRIAPKMPEPPFGGPQGLQIQVAVCAACFKEWIAMGTKVINELRLNLTEKSSQDVYDKHMMEFLGLT